MEARAREDTTQREGGEEYGRAVGEMSMRWSNHLFPFCLSHELLMDWWFCYSFPFLCGSVLSVRYFFQLHCTSDCADAAPMDFWKMWLLSLSLPLAFTSIWRAFWSPYDHDVVHCGKIWFRYKARFLSLHHPNSLSFFFLCLFISIDSSDKCRTSITYTCCFLIWP